MIVLISHGSLHHQPNQYGRASGAFTEKGHRDRIRAALLRGRLLTDEHMHFARNGTGTDIKCEAYVTFTNE